MSLINQMLEDLERRRQAPAPRLPAQLRAPTAASRPAPQRWFWLAGGLLALLTAAVLLRQPWRHRAVPKAVPPAMPVLRGAPSVAAPAPPALAPALPAVAPAPPQPSLPVALSPQRTSPPAPPATVPSTRHATVPLHATNEPPPAAAISRPASSPIGKGPWASPSAAAQAQEMPAQGASAVARPPRHDRPHVVRPHAPVPAQEAQVLPAPSPALAIRPVSPQPVSPQQQAEADDQHAVELLQTGHLADAINDLNAALLLDSGNVRARQILVSLALQARNYTHAETILADGLRLHPGQLSFVILLARLQVERHAPAEALATLVRASGAGANNAEYLAFRATLLQTLGRHPEAIRFYRQALALSGQRGAWRMGLGLSLQANQQYKEARQAYLAARESGDLSADLLAFIDQKLRQLPG